MPRFRVQEVGLDKMVLREVTQYAGNAEEAARLAFGLELFRGTGRNNVASIALRAKVYRDTTDGTPATLIRLYEAKKPLWSASGPVGCAVAFRPSRGKGQKPPSW